MSLQKNGSQHYAYILKWTLLIFSKPFICMTCWKKLNKPVLKRNKKTSLDLWFVQTHFIFHFLSWQSFYPKKMSYPRKTFYPQKTFLSSRNCLFVPTSYWKRLIKRSFEHSNVFCPHDLPKNKGKRRIWHKKPSGFFSKGKKTKIVLPLYSKTVCPFRSKAVSNCSKNFNF